MKTKPQSYVKKPSNVTATLSTTAEELNSTYTSKHLTIEQQIEAFASLLTDQLLTASLNENNRK